MTTYEFNTREEQLLIYAISEAITSTERAHNFYAVHGDMELAEKELKDIIELKVLFKRFLPDLNDDELFKKPLL